MELTSLSNALETTILTLTPSVVRVDARRGLGATGVVYQDGVVVTVHHVLERDEAITVTFADGRSSDATLAGRDPTTDLALLRTDTGGLSPLTWQDDDDLKVGRLVLALGRPGRSLRATLGMISALADSWMTRAGGRLERYMQPDLTLYPGFSGGPLVDLEGGVLGLNSAALSRRYPLTIPTRTVRRVAEALLAHGRVRRGYLGVGVQPVRLPEGASNATGQTSGLMLVSVEPGGSAAKAGLTLGDTVLTLGGEAVHHIDELQTLLSEEQIGQPLRVQVLRGGGIQEFTLTVGERP